MRRGEDMTGVEDTFGELVALLKACAPERDARGTALTACNVARRCGETVV